MRTVALLLLVVACAPSEPVATPTPTATASTTATPSVTPSPSRTPTRTPSPTRTPATPPAPTATTAPPGACPFPYASPARVVGHGQDDRAVVALTFDAGSDRGSTASILDTLAREHVVASFGVTGDFARANPALVARIAREGHQLVSHGDRHWSYTGTSSDRVVLTRTARCTDLRRAEAAIAAAAAGVAVRPWFRPPYGDYDASVLRDVAAAGYRYVAMWTVDSRGWRGVPAAEVVRIVLDGVGPGSIVLFHVGAASTDAAALPDVVAGLRQRGYRFATLAGLVG